MPTHGPAGDPHKTNPRRKPAPAVKKVNVLPAEAKKLPKPRVIKPPRRPGAARKP